MPGEGASPRPGTQGHTWRVRDARLWVPDIALTRNSGMTPPPLQIGQPRPKVRTDMPLSS